MSLLLMISCPSIKCAIRLNESALAINDYVTMSPRPTLQIILFLAICKQQPRCRKYQAKRSIQRDVVARLEERVMHVESRVSRTPDLSHNKVLSWTHLSISQVTISSTAAWDTDMLSVG